MVKRNNNARQQPPAKDTRIPKQAIHEGLVDVTFREKGHSSTGQIRGTHLGQPKQARPGSTATPAGTEPLPNTFIGLDWARSRVLKKVGQGTSTRYSARKGRRGRWLRRTLVIVPLILGLIFGVHFLLTDPYFQVHHLVIKGTHNQQLMAAIQHLHLEGSNIFLADTNAAIAQIKTLPSVADASIERMLPDTLIIQVVERQPVLIWQVGTAQYSVDATGTLIAQVQHPGGLVVVSDEHQHDLHGQPFSPGGKIDPAIVQMARQLLEQLPAEAGITGFSLRYTLQYGMVVINSDGWQARFGGPDHLDRKLKELMAILQLVKQQKQQLALVDLRFGLYPYYRLKSSATGP